MGKIVGRWEMGVGKSEEIFFHRDWRSFPRENVENKGSLISFSYVIFNIPNCVLKFRLFSDDSLNFLD